jgi:hypothetical protein
LSTHTNITTGYYFLSPFACRSCPPGTAQASAGKRNCDACDVGFFAKEAASTACEACPREHTQTATGRSTCFPLVKIHKVKPTAVRTDTATAVTLFVSGLDGTEADTFRFLRYLRGSDSDGEDAGGVTSTIDYHNYLIADTGSRRAVAPTLLLPVPTAYESMYTIWNLTFTTPLSNVTGYHAFSVNNVARIQVS